MLRLLFGKVQISIGKNPMLLIQGAKASGKLGSQLMQIFAGNSLELLESNAKAGIMETGTLCIGGKKAANGLNSNGRKILLLLLRAMLAWVSYVEPLAQ